MDIIAGVLGVLLATLAVFGGAAWRALSGVLMHLRGIDLHFKEQGVALSGELQERIRDLEDLVDRLPQRWEAIKDEADQAFKRARSAEERGRAAVSRVRQELEDRGLADDGIEAVWNDLHGADGEGSGGGPVPSVHQEMEEAQQPIREVAEPTSFDSRSDELEHVRRALRG